MVATADDIAIGGSMANTMIFSRKDIRLNRNLSKKIMVLGAPIALQDALINVSFLIITVIVNQMGVIASSSLGVVEQIP